MKKSLKFLAASLACVTAMCCSSAEAMAYKIKTIDGIKYKYTDSGEQKGKYTGWLKTKSGARYYCKDGVILKNCWLSDDGKITYYLDANGRPTVGEAEIDGVTYRFADDGKMIYGIRAKGSRATRTGIRLALDGIALGYDKAEVWTGEEYTLERKTSSGTWAKVPITADEYAWDGVAYEFFSDGRLIQRIEDVNWEWLYGKLDGGEYRLCRPYYVRITHDSAVESKMFYVPFKVVTDAESAWGISMTVSDVTTDGLTVTVTQPDTYTGYVTYDGSYILEKQDESGEWKDVDAKTRTQQSAVIFSDLDVIFGSIIAPTGKAGGTQSDSIEYYSGELENGHYRIRRSITGNCGGIKGKLYATAEFDISDTTPNGWGIKISAAGNASETGLTLYIDSVDTGLMSSEIWTDEEYAIEVLDSDGEWETIEQVDEDGYVWDFTGIELPENGRKTLRLDWENIYGKLKKGTYRISKTFYRKRGIRAIEKTMYYTFTIDDGSVNIGDYSISAKITKAAKKYIEIDLTRTGVYAGKVSWNGGYEIHRKNSSGKWTLYKSVSAMDYTADQSVTVPNNGTAHIVVPLSGNYPELKSGTYRVKLKLTDQTDHIRYFYAPVTIK